MIKDYLSRFTKKSSFSTFVVLVLMMILNVILQPGFFSPDVLKSNLSTFTPLILVSMAQAVIILVGGIDLSVGASIALINVVMASIMKDTAGSVAFALLLGIGVSMIIGAVNGVAFGVLRLPPMVATFATSAIWYGISLFIMPQPGGYVPDFFYGIYQKDVLGFLPVSLLILVFVFLIWAFIKRRKLYRYFYAVGGSEESAAASGINTAWVKVAAFVISGVFIAVASIVVTAQTASGDAHVGQAFTLNSIAAAVIGGISLKGGKGSLIGSAMGACVLGLLINVIFFANISSTYQEFIKGIIIAALAFAVLPGFKKNRIGI
jgi:ribose transport system permease protein